MKNYLLKNFYLFLVIGVGSIIFLFDLTSALHHIPWLQSRVSSITLIAISTLILYIILETSEKTKKLDGMEKMMEVNRDNIISACAGISTQVFTDSDDAFCFLIRAISNASISIDQVAIAPTPKIREDMLKEYLTTMEAVVLGGKVKYRYVFGNNYEPRRERITALSEGVACRRFLTRYYEKDKAESIPMLNFVIFDSETIFMRYPNAPHQKEIYLFVKQPEIKALFEEYYKRIWEKAEE